MTNTIYRFQVSQGIIEGPYDEGAGYYGPKTRAALTDVLYSGDSEDNNSSVNESEKRSEVVVQAQISIFDTRINSQASEDDVRELQFILRQIGYFDHDQDGRFNKRLVDAIFDFQVDYDIVDSEFDEGAGYYGPKTRSKLKEVYGVFQERQDQIRDLQTQLVGIQNDRAELLASKKAEFQARLDAMGDLQQGVTSAQVRDLQILLRELGYLDHKDTAIFGPLTQQALAKYQLELGKIESIHSQYAGILGSVTRAAIIDDLTRRFEQSDTTYIDTMKEIQGEIQELKDI